MVVRLTRFWLGIMLVTGAWAQPAATGVDGVPWVRVDNPIARLSIDMPDDWSMGSSDYGPMTIAIDAGVGVSPPSTQPVLWVFRHRYTAEEAARQLVRDLTAANGAPPRIEQAPDGAWVVSATSNGARGPLTELWASRRQGEDSFVVGAMMRPEASAKWNADVSRMVASARLIPGPPLKVQREATERAYRLWMPADWRWEGRIVRTEQVPGWFEYKVQRPDGLAGAFNGPPAIIDVRTAYMDPGTATRQLLLPVLAKMVPGLRVERVRPLPRVGAYFREGIRRAGLGTNPLCDRAEVDCLGEAGGVPLRIRLTVGTLQLDQSAILGGRGTWTIYTNGVWAPVAEFDQVYPIGRGVLASIRTDAEWRRNQKEVADAAAGFRNDMRKVFGDLWSEHFRDD
ncbi:MAG: hypothetical protein HZB16_04315 [Armatimonadetes bacterium]|nr:hypothetical protein [Armatimonadota bacterium]